MFLNLMVDYSTARVALTAGGLSIVSIPSLGVESVFEYIHSETRCDGISLR